MKHTLGNHHPWLHCHHLVGLLPYWTAGILRNISQTHFSLLHPRNPIMEPFEKDYLGVSIIVAYTLKPSTWHGHQKFQVPKMEVLNLIRPFWGWFYLTWALHTAYIGEYLILGTWNVGWHGVPCSSSIATGEVGCWHGTRSPSTEPRLFL